MKIARKQLRRIIKEAIDVVDDESGELIEFGDMEDAAAPEAALSNILKRLGIKPKRTETRGLAAGGAETSWYFSAEDYADIYHETEGKRNVRSRKKERNRMNIDNLMTRLEDWAVNAGKEYAADNDVDDLQGVAWDLAQGAEYSFEPDEWEELLYRGPFEGPDDLHTYIADIIA